MIEALRARREEPDAFCLRHEHIRVRTAECLQFIDVTPAVLGIVQATGVRDGIANVQSQHTTAAVIVNENEPLLLDDLRRTLEALAPRDAAYRHDDFGVRTVNLEPGEPDNGHAHCKALALTTSVAVNVAGGALQLGRWQRIFFLELDRARDRTLSVLVLGR